ncbi:hypothetical protein RFI_08517 [Reticulomyxa filosa]|uniref:Uncharacterized protein n=1 Tax=Reticulomyxa filosa TaxID=46433 RepID=X6NRP2_RETFI|nr:hypothetical protein RFI_08517 [Reticulomyxa filosa]|eukprot:ETO28613.1 hypothetical protein RFI_08517 [Reticulomyxa filosa]
MWFPSGKKEFYFVTNNSPFSKIKRAHKKKIFQLSKRSTNLVSSQQFASMFGSRNQENNRRRSTLSSFYENFYIKILLSPQKKKNNDTIQYKKTSVRQKQSKAQKHPQQHSRQISGEDQHKKKKKRVYNQGGNKFACILFWNVVIAEDDKDQPSYVFDTLWLIGLFLQVIGAIFDFVALGFAPQSVVAPLGSLTLVVNVCLAPIMQNEIPSKRVIFSTFVIVIGCIITVVFSAKEDNLVKCVCLCFFFFFVKCINVPSPVAYTHKKKKY